METNNENPLDGYLDAKKSYRPRGRPWTKETRPPGRWKKGESGNPSGRRKDGIHPSHLVKLGEARLSALIEDELASDDGRLARALARELVRRAISGDPYATKAVLDRVEGAVEKKVNISATMTQQMVSLLDAPKPAAFAEVEAEVMKVVEAEVVPPQKETLEEELRREEKELLDVEDLEC